METFSMVRIFCLTALLSCGAYASAGLIVSESFDYTAGEGLAGKTGGTGWSAGWTTRTQDGTTANVVSDSLSYTDSFGNTLVTSGGAVRFLGSGSPGYGDPSATRQSASYESVAKSANGLWASLLFQTGTTGVTGTYDLVPFGTGFQEGPTLDTNTSTRFGAQRTGFSNRTGTYLVNSTPTVQGILTDGSANLLVMHYTVVESGTIDQYTLDFYLNPTDMTNLGSPTATWTVGADESIVGSAGVLQGLDGFYLRHRTSATMDLLMDELRYGTDAASVLPIPEPSTFALASLSLLGLIGFGRRPKR
jgi:hypothetical protein